MSGQPSPIVCNESCERGRLKMKRTPRRCGRDCEEEAETLRPVTLDSNSCNQCLCKYSCRLLT